VTFLSYEETVLRAGVDLLAALGEDEAAAVVISRTPGEATDLLRAAGLDLDKILVLPPQSDADLFGLIGAGRVALVSNGFLQIMDALALGCPVIALARGHGVGMTDLNIAEQFYPYVSFGASQAEQVARLRGWLSTSPFSPALMAALARERGGIVYSADEIEALVCCGSVAIRGASGREHPA
jgi:glycosyltransferase involved in cell wall biosynthesis